MEWEILQEEDAECRVYLSQLEQHQDDCKQLLKQVSGTIEKLSKLDNQHGFVSNKTASLHEACEQMLIDQNKLSSLADDLEKKVSYFVEYEKIQSQLSSPTLSVHGELFHDILNRLDKCIDYMQSHVSIETLFKLSINLMAWFCILQPQYKDSLAYLTRYRACLNSALSLVRSWVQQALEQCVQQAKQLEIIPSTAGM